MACLTLTVKPIPSISEITSLQRYLHDVFPAKENMSYLQDLVDKTRPAPPHITIARLGALALLPPLLLNAKINTNELVLSRNEHGRPFCFSESSPVGFDFNVSHSKHHIACALWIGSKQVGVDLEEPLTPARAEPLIRRYCTDGERALLFGLSPQAAADEFTRIWTVREALAKQAGQGRPLLYDASRIPPDTNIFCGRVSDTGTVLSLSFPDSLHTNDVQISADSLPIIRI